jgi:hypothetical protein
MPDRDTGKLDWRGAVKELVGELTNDNSIDVPDTFSEFVKKIWRYSFPQPELFDVWHVGYVCDELDRAIDEGKNFISVLPRGHWKSSMVGHGFTVWSLARTQGSTKSILYASYNTKMVQYHVRTMKDEIRANPILSNEWFTKDLSRGADNAIRYQMADGSIVRVEMTGVTSFQRGLHTNAGMVADDLLKDANSPIDPGELPKIKDLFFRSMMPIPNPGTTTVFVGTPIAPGDLLATLVADERFNSVVLPALDPVPGRRVLAPEIRDEAWLLSYQKGNRSAFASEYMLMPHFGSDGYFNEEEIEACEDISLKIYRRTIDHTTDDKLTRDYEWIVAGYDVGKRKHPSHLVVFGKRKSDGRVVELYQEFIRNMAYTAQVDVLNQVANHFNIDKGYIDNTDRALEERGLQTDHRQGLQDKDYEENQKKLRGLNRKWDMKTFSRREKNEMASKFEYYVVNDQLRLFPDAVQKEQILIVNKDLDAAETPNGHGDSFWSIGLACLAADRLDGPSSYSELGDASGMAQGFDKKGESGLENPLYNNDMPIDEALQATLGKIFDKSVQMYGEDAVF